MNTLALSVLALWVTAAQAGGEEASAPAETAAVDDVDDDAEADSGWDSPFDAESVAADEAKAAAEEAAEVEAIAESAGAAFMAPEGADDVLNYADHLFLDGDWYRAISEYRRFLYLVKGRGEEAPRAALAVGEALLRGEQYDAAGRQLDGVAQRTSDLELRQAALFGSARAYLLDGRPELAKPRFRLLALDDATPAYLREEATWLLAWGHFDAGELDKAAELLGQIAAGEGRYAELAKGAIVALQKKDSLDEKNPLLAGALSLIPGLGHMYLGQWAVGVTSFAWNALFIFAAVVAWIQGQWGVALVLTLFEVGWYGGGVFGAIAGAVRHNRDAVRNWRDEILAEHATGRGMPDTYLLAEDPNAKPGTLMRFGGAF